MGLALRAMPLSGSHAPPSPSNWAAIPQPCSTHCQQAEQNGSNGAGSKASTYKRTKRILILFIILLRNYQQQGLLHQAVLAFDDQNTAQLITSSICIAEVLWLLSNPGDPRVLAAQNHLVSEDYARVAELNGRYADMPGDSPLLPLSISLTVG